MLRRSRAVPALEGLLDAAQVRATAESIAAAQEPGGAVPWFPGGHVDPWDHVECAMALGAAGLRAEAERAYAWLARTQGPDGGWPCRVEAGAAADPNRETAHAAYVAVGVWHHLRLTGDRGWAGELWPVVRRALDLAVAHQRPDGALAWAVSPRGEADPAALLTGSASAYQALRCGTALGEALGDPQPDWELAAGALGHAVAAHPEAFLDKARFAMDWYYPVLTGAVRGAAARQRLARAWGRFVVPQRGSRCVDDEPWVTGAETCELVLALDAAGCPAQGRALLADVQHLRDPDGAYGTGHQLDLDVRWPQERSTWTAAAVVLAVDALSRTTPAAGIFRGVGLPEAREIPGEGCSCPSGVRATQDA